MSGCSHHLDGLHPFAGVLCPLETVTIQVVKAVVPEPGSMALVLAGLPTLLWFRSRRSRIRRQGGRTESGAMG
jgi:hypothetical protein